jgi:ribonucleoside-diphosphate reductase alpha chain
MESPTIGKVSSMYMYAWKRGVKTTYYLRSRPATSINKVTVSQTGADEPTATTPAIETSAAVAAAAPAKTYTDSEAIACSLENPEACEACQ